MMDLTPPSLENTPPVEVADEQYRNPGPAVENPPPNEEFNPPLSSTPDRERVNATTPARKRGSKAEKRCKRLQAEKRALQKQNLFLKK